LAKVMTSRMTAVIATLVDFPAVTKAFYFSVSVKAFRDEGWHVNSLAQGGAAAVDMAAPSALSAVARLRGVGSGYEEAPLPPRE
jgi:hypothetical protein